MSRRVRMSRAWAHWIFAPEHLSRLVTPLRTFKGASDVSARKNSCRNKHYLALCSQNIAAHQIPLKGRLIESQMFRPGTIGGACPRPSMSLSPSTPRWTTPDAQAAPRKALLFLSHTARCFCGPRRPSPLWGSPNTAPWFMLTPLATDPLRDSCLYISSVGRFPVAYRSMYFT